MYFTERAGLLVRSCTAPTGTAAQGFLSLSLHHSWYQDEASSGSSENSHMISASWVKSSIEYLATTETNDVHVEGEQSCEPTGCSLLSLALFSSSLSLSLVMQTQVRFQIKLFTRFLHECVRGRSTSLLFPILISSCHWCPQSRCRCSFSSLSHNLLR